MSDNKKYYYLKLKENFFEDDSMIVLESMPDGYKYSNILLKLYLRSLKNEGKLMFKDRIPYNSTILAQVTRHSVGDIEKAINVFKQLDLIEVMDNGAIFITDIQNFIGESSTEADRKRAYRRRIENEKQSISTNEDKSPDKREDKSPPEISKRKDKLEIELSKSKGQKEKTSSSDDKPDTDSFESFWEIYPNKKSKKKAVKLFEKVLEEKEATFEQLIEGAKKYALEVDQKETPEKYIKHPTTWLSHGCWADKYDIYEVETDDRYSNLPF
ncbi:MAG: phage replisome organizer N-terminal domain-containing protein [Tetragenococcus halophilus]|nr:phage replisome organizer N-terminal domain-containing protein [Tetragenococcus halophilus]